MNYDWLSPAAKGFFMIVLLLCVIIITWRQFCTKKKKTAKQKRLEALLLNRVQQQQPSQRYSLQHTVSGEKQQRQEHFQQQQQFFPVQRNQGSTLTQAASDAATTKELIQKLKTRDTKTENDAEIFLQKLMSETNLDESPSAPLATSNNEDRTYICGACGSEYKTIKELKLCPC